VKPVVYIVDDDPAVRRSLFRLLRGQGCDAEMFDSAEAFLARGHCQRPAACLLLDVTLPGLDGLDLQRRLAETGKMLPIVFMTGNEDTAKEMQAFAAGAVAYLRKPMTAETLLAAVRAAIGVDDLGSPGSK
jgi:FixJ family two-component response regulator